MTKAYPFRLLDVFATEAPFSGNPLAVFPDARGLDDGQMQAIARQMNLSETTFLLPAALPSADAHVRIFTPSYEMPFAGHPTLGTAHVVAETLGRSALALGMASGLVPVSADGDRYTLSVALVSARDLEIPLAELARAVGLDEEAFALPVQRIDTGTEQIICSLRSPESLDRISIDTIRFLALPKGKQPTKVLLWAKQGPHHVRCRFFFPVYGAAGGSVAEDPGTGSAAANLGGYLLANGHAGPLAPPVRWTLSQGDRTGRPCEIGLALDGDKIAVSGRVRARGEGRLFV